MKIPEHIAIIMDGNGRWARQRKKPRIFGHRAGIASVREVVETCGKLGVKYLTLYSFSVENWRRPISEVRSLMRFLETYLQKELIRLTKNNVRLLAIGRINELPLAVQNALEKAIKKTENNKGLTLVLALNYGGRTEIVDAVRKIIENYGSDKAILDELDEHIIERFLYTSNIPDPDLVVRTSGEMRISNFLLWQISYAELWVTPTLWPDFRKRDLLSAIEDFQKRKRRFGRVKSVS